MIDVTQYPRSVVLLLYDYNFGTDRRYLDIEHDIAEEFKKKFFVHFLHDDWFSNLECLLERLKSLCRVRRFLNFVLNYGKISKHGCVWYDSILRWFYSFIRFHHWLSVFVFLYLSFQNKQQSESSPSHSTPTANNVIGFRPKDQRGYLACFCADTTISSQVEIVDGKYLFSW